MSSSQDPGRAGHQQRAAIQIPQFRPLPESSFINRVINRVLAPLFYLLFSIITAIVVVPIYTMVENFKTGRNSRGGQRMPKDEDPDRPQRRSQAKDFLSGFSSSYDGGPKNRHGHNHQSQDGTEVVTGQST